MMITLQLNGSAYQVEDGSTVSDLVASLSLTGKAIAVAINREVLSDSDWPQRRLLATDSIDIVRAIGGG
ncbi:sulfur carrier protein ThiS [Herminiimonas glaciei]|uniref:Sulfur carrier protein ThiS n=1 Tax=Herminiimonas glaciei TaxID=523788 RepID=A0ABW2IFC0_9BURK